MQRKKEMTTIGKKEKYMKIDEDESDRPSTAAN